MKDNPDYESLANKVEATDKELAAFFRSLATGVTENSNVDTQHTAHSSLIMQLYMARRRKGLTQAQLAAQLGMAQSSLARLESNRSNPTLHTLLKIAEALDVTITLQPKR